MGIIFLPAYSLQPDRSRSTFPNLVYIVASLDVTFHLIIVYMKIELLMCLHYHIPRNFIITLSYLHMISCEYNPGLCVSEHQGHNGFALECLCCLVQKDMREVTLMEAKGGQKVKITQHGLVI